MLDIEILKETLDLLWIQRKTLNDRTSDQYKSIVKCIKEIEKEVKEFEKIGEIMQKFKDNQAKQDDIIEDFLSEREPKCVCGLTGAHYCIGAPGESILKHYSSRGSRSI